jgi:hypothetical protein
MTLRITASPLANDYELVALVESEISATSSRMTI